ncbi:haloacid dehalogenase, partial [Streptococcus suis]
MVYAQNHNMYLCFVTAKGLFGSKIMSAGTVNFAYRVTRIIPESWSGIINFIFNRLLRWISPQQETTLKG